jgi:hypothetical protein
VKLGHVNVDAMLRQISMKQFREWQAFQDLEPFDETRADARAASIRQTLAEIHRNRDRRKDAYTIGDFLIHFGDSEKAKPTSDEPARPSAADLKFIAMQHAIIANAEEELARKRRR